MVGQALGIVFAVAVLVRWASWLSGLSGLLPLTLVCCHRAPAGPMCCCALQPLLPGFLRFSGGRGAQRTVAKGGRGGTHGYTHMHTHMSI